MAFLGSMSFAFLTEPLKSDEEIKKIMDEKEKLVKEEE